MWRGLELEEARAEELDAAERDETRGAFRVGVHAPDERLAGEAVGDPELGHAARLADEADGGDAVVGVPLDVLARVAGVGAARHDREARGGELAAKALGRRARRSVPVVDDDNAGVRAGLLRETRNCDRGRRGKRDARLHRVRISSACAA